MPLSALQEKSKTTIAFWGVVCAALIPWFVIRVQQTTNSDILWLCEALHRYFSGLKLTDAAYETNPPLSLLIYTLPVLAQDMLHIPLHYAVFAQTCVIIAVCALAVHKILSGWNKISPEIVAMATGTYILANTLGASLYFGERDHLIGILLVPFMLMQLALTYDLPVPRRWKWPVFAFGTLFILLKPHHGLLPSLLLLHRIIDRKNLSVLKDADFISLAVGTMSYIALICFVFPDYVSIILPDVVRLYTIMGGWTYVGEAIQLSLAACGLLSLALYFTPGDRPEKTLAGFFIFGGVVSLIPYYVQGMGLYYHLMPVLSFVAPAAAMIVYLWLRAEGGRKLACLVTILIAAVISYIYAPLNIAYPHHGDYEPMPVSKVLEKECPKDKPCSFFMFNRDMGILHETAYYLNMHHASRFPSFWFMPEIVKAQQNIKNGKPSALTKKETQDYFDKYSEMVARDLADGKPDVLLIWRSKDTFLKADFGTYFSRNKTFSTAWKRYKKVDSLTLSYATYYRGTRVKDEKLTYDIYRRMLDKP